MLRSSGLISHALRSNGFRFNSLEAPKMSETVAENIASKKVVEGEGIVAKSRTLWSKGVAFTCGVGVSSVVYFLAIQREVSKGSLIVRDSIADMKNNQSHMYRDLLEKVALLEHEVDYLKKQIERR